MTVCFVADENIEMEIVEILRAQGHEILYIAALLLQRVKQSVA